MADETKFFFLLFAVWALPGTVWLLAILAYAKMKGLPFIGKDIPSAGIWVWYIFAIAITGWLFLWYLLNGGHQELIEDVRYDVRCLQRASKAQA